MRGEVDRDDSEPYETWWFWTGAGVIVAAGVVSAMLIARSDPETRDPVVPMGSRVADLR